MRVVTFCGLSLIALCAIAVAREPLGIDAPASEDRPPSPALIRQITTPDEIAAMQKTEGVTRADVLVRLGDHHFLACGGEQVGHLYRHAIELEPRHVRANLGLGEWLVLHGKYREALPYLKKALRLETTRNRDKPETPLARHAKAVIVHVRARLRAQRPSKSQES